VGSPRDPADTKVYVLVVSGCPGWHCGNPGVDLDAIWRHPRDPKSTKTAKRDVREPIATRRVTGKNVASISHPNLHDVIEKQQVGLLWQDMGAAIVNLPSCSDPRALPN
jgi:hypothetical protein